MIDLPKHSSIIPYTLFIDMFLKVENYIHPRQKVQQSKLHE